MLTQLGNPPPSTTLYHNIHTQTYNSIGLHDLENHNCVTVPVYTSTGCQFDTQHDSNDPNLRNALIPPLHSTISNINASDALDSKSLTQQLQLDFPAVFANREPYPAYREPLQ